jgi:hypothetical protein
MFLPRIIRIWREPRKICEHKIELMVDAQLINKDNIEWIWYMH